MPGRTLRIIRDGAQLRLQRASDVSDTVDFEALASGDMLITPSGTLLTVTSGIKWGGGKTIASSDAVLDTDQVKRSVEVDAGEVQLVGDVDAPGNAKLYGTDGSGNRGWVGVKASIEMDGGDFQLVGDVASPAADQFYGTDGAGNRGWQNVAAFGVKANTTVFTATGTWTVPAGVELVRVFVAGGGGGGAQGHTASSPSSTRDGSDGGSSSFDPPSASAVTALGGLGGLASGVGVAAHDGLSGGAGGSGGFLTGTDHSTGMAGTPGELKVELVAVVPAEDVTITVGAGGAGGTGASAENGGPGGDGIVIVEW